MKDHRDKARKSSYDQARYRARKAQLNALKPPDPITLISIEDLCYIAGIVDGEGCIFVGAVGPHRKKTVYPIVFVGMCHRPVIEWLRERWDAGKVLLHNRTKLIKNPHYMPQWRVTLSGQRAQLLCQHLLPYLRVKREQARLVTLFPCTAYGGPGVKLSPEINALRFSLRDRINRLNHPPEKEAA